MSDDITVETVIKDLRSALEGARDLLDLVDPEMTDDYQELGVEIERALEHSRYWAD